MATKNQTLHKASWLGFKIDVLNFVAKLSYGLSKLATEKKHEYQEEQDSLLEDIAMNYLSKTEDEQKQ